MPKIQNKDLLNSIRAEQSAEYQEKVVMATGTNDHEIYTLLENYPSLKNEFINQNRPNNGLNSPFLVDFVISACNFFILY